MDKAPTHHREAHVSKALQPAAPRASLPPSAIPLGVVFLPLCTPKPPALPAGEKEPCPAPQCPRSLRFTPGWLKRPGTSLLAVPALLSLLRTPEVTLFTR